MVYTIAAYTLTLGVLALYWVMVRYRRQEFASELASLGQAEARDPQSGFNLGACLLAPLWMLKHGLVLPGGFLLVATATAIPLYHQEMWVPMIFVGILPIAGGTALGFVANRIGVAHTKLEQPGAFAASQLPWAIGGVLLYLVILPWAWYFTMGA